jgi:hypothetical protein
MYQAFDLFPSPREAVGRDQGWGVAQRMPLSASLPIDPPPPTPPRHALTRAEGGEKMMPRVHSTPPHSRGALRPSFAKIFALETGRAQGKPDARCTRSLACEIKKHTSVVTTGSPGQPGLPCTMVYGLLRALPGDQAFLTPSSADKKLRRLDADLEASGPHVFAVRVTRRSSRAHPRPPHPVPRP